MRIIFLIADLTESGGAERAVCGLSGELARMGHDVTITVLSGSKSFYEIADNVKIKYLNSPALPHGKSPARIHSVVDRAKKVRQSVKSLSPDVVIGMSHIMSAYAVFSTKFTSAKSIGTERSNPYMLSSTRFITLLRRLTSLLCDGFVFQTQAAREFFPQAMHKKSAVIANGLFNPDIAHIQPVPVRDKTVSSMGRLTQCKGFDVLIDAFSQVLHDFPDYKLIIYGSGELSDSLQALAQEKGIAHCVQLPGSTPDAAKLVAHSRVFVLSSRMEGMPNALMEAMACGVACVSTDCRMGPRELISDGENGILVPVDDATAMAQSIKMLLSNEDLSNKIAKNALKIRDTHSIESIAEQWITFLSSNIK